MADERLPILPGRTDRPLGPLVNKALRDGPEFLGLQWLNKRINSMEEFSLLWNVNRGVEAMYVLQGAIVAPIVRDARRQASRRGTLGLVYDLDRERSKPRRPGKYVKVESLHAVVKPDSSEPMNPYEALWTTTDDTLKLTLDERFDDLERTAKRKPNSALGGIYRRFMQLNDVSRRFYPERATVMGHLYNGIGTGTVVSSALIRAVPDLYVKKYDFIPDGSEFSANLFQQTAENSYPLVAELAALDKRSFVEILQPLFFALLRGDERALNYLRLDVGGGKARVDLTDSMKIIVQTKAALDPAAFRLGCPFMAAVDRSLLPEIKNEEQKPRTPGVDELWRWVLSFGDQIYHDLFTKSSQS